jgi:ABC-type bacteriocin/lantibiotic exporter with double-glycine peptidase domain
MVLASFGINRPEDELRELCDCTIFGAAAIELVRAARSLGFSASRKYSLSLENLRELTEQGYFPVVYVVVAETSPKPDVHALVVVSVTETEIKVLDPQRGPLTLSIAEFNAMWTPMNGLTIVIVQSPADGN